MWLPFSLGVGAPFIPEGGVLQVEDAETLCGRPFMLSCYCFLPTSCVPFVMAKVLLETGTLVTFTVARHSGDMEGIVIDRTLMTQLDKTINKGSGHCTLGGCGAT